MANIGDLVATASLDIAPFEGSMKQLKMSTKGLDSMLKTVEKSVKGQGDKLSGLKSTYAQTGQSLTAYQTLLDKQSKKYNELKTSIGDINNATAKQKEDLIGARNAMAETANKLTDLQNKYSALGREIAIQSSVFTKAGNSLQTFGNKLNSISSTTGKIASATKGMSLAIGASMGYGVKQALEFNNSMTATQALLADTVPANQMNAVITKLSDNSKKWAMEYGLSTKSVNEGMQELVKAGYDANQVTASMPAILNASKASGEDFNTVMEATTSILSQYGLGAKEAGRVTDSLTFVANKTKAGFKDMGDAMVYVGPVAKSIGMDLEQTASAIGILSNAGIQGEKAGTALRGALTRLLKPSKQNSNAMKDLGFTTEEFKKGQIGLPDIIDRIKESTEGMTQAEKASLIAKAFGTESQTAMNALVNEGSEALRGLTKETKGATGYTKELAKAMNSTDSAKFAQAKAKMEVLAITIGQKLLPIIVPLVEDIADLASKFAELPEPVQKNILYLGLFLGAISPVSGAISKTTGLLGGLSGGFGKVLSAMGEIGAEKRAATALESVATSAGGASASIGLLGNPATWGVILGGATVLALGLIANNMRKAHQRTQEWGAEVDRVQSEELSKLKSKVDDTNFAMDAFANSKDGVEQVKGSVEKVKQAFDELAISINKSLDEQFNEDVDLARKYGFSDEAIADMQRQNDQVKSNIIDMSEQVKAIYEKHGGDMSKLSQAENDLILRNQQEMIGKQLDQMKFSNDEKKALQAVLNNELDKLNSMQLERVITNTDEMTKKENKTYQKNKDELLTLMESYGDKQSVAYKEAKEKLEDLEADHNLKMSAYNEQWLKTQKARIDDMKANGESSEQIALRQLDVIDEIMERYGVGEQRAEDMLNSAITTGNEMSTILSNISADASEQVKNANEAWDILFTSANPSEKLKEMIGSVEGWNNFKVMVKDVDVNPIGRMKLAEMLVESGKWNEMTYAEKQLVVDGSTAMREIFDSQELLKQWNALTPEQKAIVAENKVREPTMAAQQMIDSVKQSKPVDIKASDKTYTDVNRAKSAVNSVPNRHVSLTASDGISGTVDWINSKLRSLENRRVNVNIDPNVGHLATGTNYHPGGLAVVNDQKGSTYRELISLPNGESFIPEGRDVMLPLPKGTKVLKASDTKKLFPHYADGIGFENTRIARLTERMRAIPEEKITATYQSDNKEVRQLLAQLLSLTGQGTELMSQIVRGVNDIYDKESYMVLDDGTLVAETGNKFAKHFSSIERRNKRLRGETV
ncbi:TPA: phage tail tape measure protein [Streptococcus suis]